MKAHRICGLLLLFATVALCAQDGTNSTVVSKIIAMEKAWNQAFKLRDRKAVDTLLDDNVVLVNDDGSLQSKGEFLKMVTAAPSSDDEQVTPESIKVHVAGDVAIATGVFRVKGIEKGKAFNREDRFVDTWVQKGGTWVCISASATAVQH
jgi:ketosteroid isomerase-like protein